MSRQVRSDGRIQAALLEALKRNDIGLAKLAGWITRRNLRCCNLKALETILESWTKKVDAEHGPPYHRPPGVEPSYMCGDGGATVRELLQVFITIRRKQSPVWRKEHEAVKATVKEWVSSLAKDKAKLDELDKTLKPETDAPASARRPGMATPAEELRKWPNSRLLSEIRKQIRRDFGGRSEDWVLAWIITELQGKTPREQAVWIHNLLGKQIKGCRDRVESKLKELERRGDGQNN